LTFWHFGILAQDIGVISVKILWAYDNIRINYIEKRTFGQIQGPVNKSFYNCKSNSL
jgi:hypothetical protein